MQHELLIVVMNEVFFTAEETAHNETYQKI